MKLIATALVAACWLGASAAGASAQVYEPNDTLDQAYGPLVGGQDYEAAQETSNDVDWFYFNVTGQRQFDIALTNLGGCLTVSAQLTDTDGRGIASFSAVSTIAHLKRTSPGRRQYALRLTTSKTGCAYRINVTPADALTSESPGLTAELNTPDSDAIQRVYLDGQLMGQTDGSGYQSIALGHPGPASQITFEVQNVSGGWSWDAAFTSVEGRGATTIFSEKQSSSAGGRFGIVRRVVLTPSGGIISTCGEVVAPVTCFPRDSDGDGVEDNADQCRDSKGAAPTGCPDADADGVPDDSDACETAAGPAPRGCPVAVRATAAVTLRRRGNTYSGRVSSPQPACAAGRRVVLRLVGRGTRAHGSATTSSSGSFTIRRSRRLRGRVYVALKASRTDTLICEKSASRRIRG